MEAYTFPSRLRLGLTLIIVLMVVSSPIIMLVDPSLLAASPGADVTTYAPSTLSQGGSDFTAQAPLSPPGSFLSTDIVGSKSIYEIVFVTATTGTIKKIEMTFPAGTVISGANILDRVGIGSGTLIKSGTTLTLDVQNAVSVPAGTYIRLEIVNIKNPLSPSSAYTVTVTTRNPANGVIDGPTQSTAYNIRRIGSNDIADGAVTTTQIADGAISPDVIERVTPVLATENGFGTGVALCMFGEEATGGGYTIINGLGVMFVQTEERVDPGPFDMPGWKVEMRTIDGFDHNFQVRVECMPAMP